MSEKDLPIDISKDSSCSSIFQSNIDSKILLSLSDFFQYQMANTSDSPLSLKIDSNLSEKQKNELYARLLNSANIVDSDILFSPILRNKINEIRKMELSDSTLKCDRIKGFFHQKNPSKSGVSQHKVDALFKHIRDSFAHGRISFVDSFLILEDKVNELTGRLVITTGVLYQWKTVIEDYLLEINRKDDNNGTI